MLSRLAQHIQTATAVLPNAGSLSNHEAASLLLRSLRHWRREKGVDYFDAHREAEASFLRDLRL